MLVFRRLKDKNKTKKCPKVSMSQDDCSFFFTSVIVVRNHLFGAKPQQSDLPIPFDKIFAALKSEFVRHTVNAEFESYCGWN